MKTVPMVIRIPAVNNLIREIVESRLEPLCK